MLEHFEDAVDVHDRILEQVDNLLDAHSGGAAASLQGVTSTEVELRMKARQARSDAKMERETVKDKPQHRCAPPSLALVGYHRLCDVCAATRVCVGSRHNTTLRRLRVFPSRYQHLLMPPTPTHTRQTIYRFPDWPIDNTSAAFIPKIFFKPHAKVALEVALQPPQATMATSPRAALLATHLQVQFTLPLEPLEPNPGRFHDLYPSPRVWWHSRWESPPMRSLPPLLIPTSLNSMHSPTKRLCEGPQPLQGFSARLRPPRCSGSKPMMSSKGSLKNSPGAQRS